MVCFSQRVSCISQIKHRAGKERKHSRLVFSLHYILVFLLDLVIAIARGWRQIDR